MNNKEKKELKIFLKKNKIYKLFKKRFDITYGSARTIGGALSFREYLNKIPLKKVIFNAFYWDGTHEGFDTWNWFHVKLIKELCRT